MNQLLKTVTDENCEAVVLEQIQETQYELDHPIPQQHRGFLISHLMTLEWILRDIRRPRTEAIDANRTP